MRYAVNVVTNFAARGTRVARRCARQLKKLVIHHRLGDVASSSTRVRDGTKGATELRIASPRLLWKTGQHHADLVIGPHGHLPRCIRHLVHLGLQTQPPLPSVGLTLVEVHDLKFFPHWHSLLVEFKGLLKKVLAAHHPLDVAAQHTEEQLLWHHLRDALLPNSCVLLKCCSGRLRIYDSVEKRQRFRLELLPAGGPFRQLALLPPLLQDSCSYRGHVCRPSLLLQSGGAQLVPHAYDLRPATAHEVVEQPWMFVTVDALFKQ
mmetsp:Transcript_19039/g.50940  ORF Transcript_19039/g.50940 Transcript_19039/m.50940 type:complete len:263 (-) Transcript_19039:221-1009(-)